MGEEKQVVGVIAQSRDDGTVLLTGEPWVIKDLAAVNPGATFSYRPAGSYNWVRVEMVGECESEPGKFICRPLPT